MGGRIRDVHQGPAGTLEGIGNFQFPHLCARAGEQKHRILRSGPDQRRAVLPINGAALTLDCLSPVTGISVLDVLVLTHDLLGDPFWRPFMKGLNDAADSTGVSVDHRKPDVFSLSAMSELLKRAREIKPDGLLTTVPDWPALKHDLLGILDAGIPTIIVNTLFVPEEKISGLLLCQIGSEDGEGGRLAAEELLARTKVRRALCVDHYRVRNVCHLQRIKGFRDRLTREGADVVLLQISGGEIDQSVTELVRTVRRSQPTFDAVLTLGPPAWRSVEHALQTLTDFPKPAHVTFDLTVETLSSIEAGRTLGALECHQYFQAYLGIVFMKIYLTQGWAPNSDILTGPHFIGQDNVADARARVLAGTA